MDVLKKMKTFDAYPKTLEDFRVRTTSGAVGTMPCLSLALHNPPRRVGLFEDRLPARPHSSVSTKFIVCSHLSSLVFIFNYENIASFASSPMHFLTHVGLLYCSFDRQRLVYAVAFPV